MRGSSGYLIEVCFLNKNKEPSSDKTYFYFVSSEIMEPVIGSESFNCFTRIYLFPHVFTMENNTGYTYRNSEVALLKSTYIPPEDWTNLSIENSPWKEIVYLGYIGQLVKKIEIVGKLKEWCTERENFIANGILKVNNESEVDNINNSVQDYLNPSFTTNAAQAYNCAVSNIPSFPSNTVQTSNYTVSNISSFATPPYSLQEEINKMSNQTQKGNNMDSFNKMFKFGRVNDVKMSIYGPAFMGGDSWISRNDGEWIDVSDLLIDIGNTAFCFMMPVAKSNISEGDFILHQNKWVCVAEVHETFLEVEKMGEQEIVSVLPVRNPFGFEFYTKLITPFENGFMRADESNPFGMLPMLMLMGENKSNANSLLPFMLMNEKMDMSNPLMLMLMCGDSKDNMLPLMLMYQQAAQNKESNKI